MSFITQIAEIADILGILNFSQNLKQSKELKVLKVILRNETLIMRKLDDLDKQQNINKKEE